MKLMLCEKSEPFDSASFIFEPKLDGVRCLLGRTNGITTLTSRGGKALNHAFPDVANLPDGEDSYLLDGEIVVLRDKVPHFPFIQQRIGKVQPIQIKQACREYPALFMAFDILERDGKDLRRLPLLERKKRLEKQQMPYQRVPYVHERGKALFEVLVEQGWEGIVGKHIESPYLDKRSRHWLKMKKSQEGMFVVCGYTRGQGNREGLPGALVLAEATPTGFRYVGEAGTGLTFEALRQLNEKLVPVSQSLLGVKIPDLVSWCEPTVIVDVSYMERTNDGKLRFPAVKRIYWKGAK